MIASAFLLPGIGIGLSAALKTSLIVSGALMAVQGVVALFQKAPTASKSDDPPPPKYLGVTKNTTAQGTRITLACGRVLLAGHRSEEHTSELQSPMRISYAVFCLKKKTPKITHTH